MYLRLSCCSHVFVNLRASINLLFIPCFYAAVVVVVVTEKIRLKTPCDLSAWQTIHMKYSLIFCEKKNI